MNRYTFRARCAGWVVAWLLVSGAALGQGQKPITLDDWLRAGVFRAGYGQSFAWMANDNYYTTLENGALKKNPILTKEAVTELVAAGAVKDPATGEAIELGEYVFSPDETQVLFLTESEPIYRHSARHVAYLFNTKTQTTQRIFDGEPVENLYFSPNGARVGFTHGNNLFVQDAATGKVSLLTTDGKAGSIINGSTDWVYEEEFGFPEGYYFSPDGNRVAYYRFDESEVPLFTMNYYTGLYPEPYTFKYPKAGERNSAVQLFVHDLQKGTRVQVQVPADPEQYFPAVRWTPSGDQLAVLRMNRHQNQLEVLLADPATGATRPLLTESSDTYIELMGNVTERLTNLQFLSDGKHFVYLSESSGYAHLYRYDMSGKLLNAITAGAWDVTSLYGIDEASGTVYYQSAEAGPLERHVYAVGLDGKKKQLLTPGAGTHDAEFSSGYRYFVHTHSSAQTPPIIRLREASGREIRTLETNESLQERLTKYSYAAPSFFKVMGPSGDSLNAWMMRPPDFTAQRRYPVLMYVYGGPGSQTVTNSWALGGQAQWAQVLASKGYIVVSVDGRGTGARGVKFKKCTYRQLGKYEVEDQIAAAKYLATLPYVDGARIGIWGWSYGGYMTLNCLMKGAQVFKTGIAVAPVTNWRFYDTIYTERYQRTPQENPEGYDENSPITHVSKLEDNFLLVHGTGDDNVHYQNSLMLVEALVQANKQFEVFFYPNKNHGIYGGNTRYHLYTQLTAFIEANL